MRNLLMLAAIIGCLSAVSACSAPTLYSETEEEIRITFGPGGAIPAKARLYERFRQSGKTVVLDGHLISADAFFGFGLANACYTDRAIFSPHAASYLNGLIRSEYYTDYLTAVLPKSLGDWFRSQAGYDTTVGWEMLEFDQLVQLWPEGACAEDVERSLADFTARKARLDRLKPVR